MRNSEEGCDHERITFAFDGAEMLPYCAVCSEEIDWGKIDTQYITIRKDMARAEAR